MQQKGRKMEKEELDELAKKHDEKWDEVMAVAKKNGFIVQAFSGTASLVTNKNQIEQEMNSSLEQINQEEL